MTAREPISDRDIAEAFDGQAREFERAPVQTDARLLQALVAFCALPADALVLDAGCGPGLVSRALLEAGHRVRGLDLSAEMVRRARERCRSFGDRARFEQRSLFDAAPEAPCDAAVSRFVLHHVPDPLAFVRRQMELVAKGGAIVVCDQTTDPDPARAAWHQDIERRRDRTHQRHLSGGALVDLLAAAGLREVRLDETPIQLDFDEWFDRGTPGDDKAAVRARILAGSARGFAPVPGPDATLRIDGWLAMARGRLG